MSSAPVVSLHARARRRAPVRTSASPRAAPEPARRAPHAGRPSDRLESWYVSEAAAQALALCADEASLAPGTAACLAVEHGLLLRELPRLFGDVATALDARAARATPARELTDASALYLRSLTADLSPAPTKPSGALRLPARLSDRLLIHGGPEPLLSGDLDQARSWERASVMAGATMTEWALTALASAAAA